MIEKSEKQRRREPSKKEKDARREARKASREPQPVKVYKGVPFSEAAAATTTAASDFAKPRQHSRAQGPRLKLKAGVRKELFDGGHPRLAIPRRSPKGRVAYPCPVEVGDVVELSGQVSIGVTGVTETKTEYELHYLLLDDRARALGKAIGYSTSDEGAIATRKGVEGEGERMGGPQFRDEAEPEALHAEVLCAITDESKDVTLARLKQNRAMLQAQYDRMQEEGEPAGVLWGLRRSLTQLNQRIENLERDAQPRAA